MAIEDANESTVRYAPDAYRMVPASTGHELFIRTKRDALNPLTMTAKGVENPPTGNLPQQHVVVAASTHQKPSAGTKRHTRDGASVGL